jgi:hypothetical protein
MNSKCSKEIPYFIDTAPISVRKNAAYFWGISSFDSKDTTLFGIFY